MHFHTASALRGSRLFPNQVLSLLSFTVRVKFGFLIALLLLNTPDHVVAGQIVAVHKKMIGGTSILYYTYTNHWGNVAVLSYTGGTPFDGSLARYDPFGTMTTAPATNPSISNHGFTGHKRCPHCP